MWTGDDDRSEQRRDALSVLVAVVSVVACGLPALALLELLSWLGTPEHWALYAYLSAMPLVYHGTQASMHAVLEARLQTLRHELRWSNTWRPVALSGSLALGLLAAASTPGTFDAQARGLLQIATSFLAYGSCLGIAAVGRTVG